MDPATKETPVDCYVRLCREHGVECCLEVLAALTTRSLGCSLVDRASPLRDADAKCIAGLLRRFPALEVLNLEGNEIEQDGILSIANMLKANDSLHTLRLGANRFRDGGVITLAHAIAVNTALTSLDLSHNRIGGVGCKALAGVLSTSASLQELVLHGNAVDANAVAHLAESLLHNKSLLHLHLGQNDLGGKGTVALTRLVRVNLSLSTLDISSNRITDSECADLIDSLPSGTPLERLNLRSNFLGERSFNAMARVFASPMVRLREVFLGYNAPPPKVVELLIDNACRARTLRTLDIHGCVLHSVESINKLVTTNSGFACLLTDGVACASDQDIATQEGTWHVAAAQRKRLERHDNWAGCYVGKEADRLEGEGTSLAFYVAEGTMLAGMAAPQMVAKAETHVAAVEEEEATATISSLSPVTTQHYHAHEEVLSSGKATPKANENLAKMQLEQHVEKLEKKLEQERHAHHMQLTGLEERLRALESVEATPASTSIDVTVAQQHDTTDSTLPQAAAAQPETRSANAAARPAQQAAPPPPASATPQSLSFGPSFRLDHTQGNGGGAAPGFAPLAPVPQEAQLDMFLLPQNSNASKASVPQAEGQCALGREAWPQHVISPATSALPLQPAGHSHIDLPQGVRKSPAVAPAAPPPSFGRSLALPGSNGVAERGGAFQVPSSSVQRSISPPRRPASPPSPLQGGRAPVPPGRAVSMQHQPSLSPSSSFFEGAAIPARRRVDGAAVKARPFLSPPAPQPKVEDTPLAVSSPSELFVPASMVDSPDPRQTVPQERERFDAARQAALVVREKSVMSRESSVAVREKSVDLRSAMAGSAGPAGPRAPLAVTHSMESVGLSLTASRAGGPLGVAEKRTASRGAGAVQHQVQQHQQQHQHQLHQHQQLHQQVGLPEQQRRRVPQPSQTGGMQEPVKRGKSPRPLPAGGRSLLDMPLAGHEGSRSPPPVRREASSLSLARSDTTLSNAPLALAGGGPAKHQLQHQQHRSPAGPGLRGASPQPASRAPSPAIDRAMSHSPGGPLQEMPSLHRSRSQLDGVTKRVSRSPLPSNRIRRPSRSPRPMANDGPGVDIPFLQDSLTRPHKQRACSRSGSEFRPGGPSPLA